MAAPDEYRLQGFQDQDPWLRQRIQAHCSAPTSLQPNPPAHAKPAPHNHHEHGPARPAFPRARPLTAGRWR